MTAVFLALGSNLGDRLAHLRTAIAELARLGDQPRVSAIYATDPVGGPPGQQAYLNCVMRIDTEVPPHDLLRAGLALEQAAGRVRTVKDGPRPLDVDILLYGDARIDDADLSVPHPRMFERAFVLVPLLDLAPDVVPEPARAVTKGEPGTHVRRIGTLEG